MKYLCENGHITNVHYEKKLICCECIDEYNPKENTEVKHRTNIPEPSKQLDIERRLNELESSFNSLMLLIQGKK